MDISIRRPSYLRLRSSCISITKRPISSLFYTCAIDYRPHSRIEKIFQATPMMSAILTVSDLAFSSWIDAIRRATHSIYLPAKITTTAETRLVQISSQSLAISLHSKLLDAGYAIDK